MSSELRHCQNCKQDFVIETEDFVFYDKMQVPAPTWCVDCRLQRRLSFRNERNLYKRKCDAYGHEEQIISIYSSDKKYIVYDQNYWRSDNWDPMDYGTDIDESVPFMKQVAELMKKVPMQALLNFNAVRSDYCNYTTDNKDCYLVFGGDFNEDCIYGGFPMRCKQSADLYWVLNSELCYDVTDADKCFNVKYSSRIGFCSDSMFLYNCVNLSNCFGCVNLRNKSYCIFNQQYSKEDFKKKLEELRLNSYKEIQRLKEKFEQFKLTQPCRFAHNIQVTNSTGDNLYQVNDVKHSFDIVGPAEHLKDVFLGGWVLTDTRGCDHLGHSVELAHDSYALFSGCSNIVCSFLVSSSNNVCYSYNCHGGGNLFGCVGLRNKSYCILNKQYAKEEYEALIPSIRKQMTENPYIDSQKREYVYGDFFASELSLFGYNETVVQEYFPLNEQKAKSLGYVWHVMKKKDYQPTMTCDALSDTIREVKDDILKEIIGCEDGGNCDENCTTAFRMTEQELELYRRLDVPMPRFCPNCRHAKRLRNRYPMQLWKRKCDCQGQRAKDKTSEQLLGGSTAKYEYVNEMGHFHGDEPCPNEFETTYSPDRKEIVYCESCYQQEVN